MKLEQWQNLFYVIVNEYSIVQLGIQIKTRITKHTNVNVRIIIHAKNIKVGTLANKLMRIASI